MKPYTVTARAKASCVFPESQVLGMNYDLGGQPLQLRMYTRRKGEDGAIYGDLALVAIGQAETVHEAAALVTRGREMAGMVSLVANAAIEPLEAELVYETTQGQQEREYFQRFVPDDQISYADRTVPMEATSAFISALAQHNRRDRLIRAISQYAEALQRWEHGNELLALAHLFMGVEAIKTAYWRQEVERLSTTEEELAAEWGFEPGGRLRARDFLDRHARLRLVFKGDATHHRIAKLVSDSFEHGFANGGDLFEAARDALVPTAGYLRGAILDLVGLPEDHKVTLLGAPYSDPKGPSGIEQYFYATLFGEVDQLAAEGQDHPFCVWEVEIVARREEDGSRTYEHKPRMTPVIGKEIQLLPLRHEVFARGTFKPKSAAERKAESTNETTDPC